MPTVPRLTRPQVSTTPLPGVRVPTGVPQGAIGGAPLPDLSGVTQAASDLIARQRQQADQVAFLDADNRLATAEREARAQATQLRGRDAMGATKAARERWEQQVGEIEAGLKTDVQRQAFRSRVQQRAQNLYESTERHAETERRRYDDDTTQAARLNRVNDAVANAADPQKRDQAIAELRAVNADYAKRMGFAPEAADALTAEWVSRAHTGVLSRLLAAGQDQSAAAYYAEHQAEILGTDRPQVEKALQVGSTEGEAQRRADTLITKTQGKLTRREALAALQAIDDPDVRKATGQNLDLYFARRDRAESDEYDALTERVYGQLVETGRVPSPLLARLKPRDLASVRAYQKALAAGIEPKTDWQIYYGLQTAAADPTTRDTFLGTDLLGYRGQLSDGEFKELVGLQARLKKGEEAPELRGFLTTTQIVNDALPRDVKRDGPESADFRRAVDQAVVDWKTAHGKPEIPADEVRKITAGVLGRKVFVEGRFFGDDEKPAFGKGAVREDERGRSYVPYAQIPPADKASILRAFNSRRVAPTLKQQERAYAAYLLGDRARFDAIVAGTP